MCLVVFAHNSHPNYKFIFAANRDEFYDRPTEQADFWKDRPDLLAGKDLKGGGTWMGITKAGKFAAITNYRDLYNIKEDAPTRGLLVTDYLLGDQSSEDYYDSLKKDLSDYNGFNLILGDLNNLYFFSTHADGLRKINTGVHGLSNAVLDTPWPKVEKSKKHFLKLMQHEELHAWELLSLLSDTRKAKEKDLPDTGVGIEWEKVLSSVFIQSPNYGTRCSTAVLIDNNNNVRFAEKTFFGNQGAFSNKDYNFTIEEN
ncbi:MAG: NRDE family protein [Ignavibacterium sp.]|nr:MAG: NRDE family protein [Ignavibacterium sp.]